MANQLTDVDDPTIKVFAVVWDDGTVSAVDGKRVSEMYDRADCDGMESAIAILAADQDGQPVKVTVGESRKINTDQECPFRYAESPIMAGTRRVGTVTFTDH